MFESYWLGYYLGYFQRKRLYKDVNKFDLAEVFTPSDTPTLTYVGRVDLRLEAKFSSYMKMPNMVNSISGPSKSGKTVLINKSLDNETVIPVIGSGITSAENL